MEIREDIKSQFSLLGFELTDAVLDKCVEICVLHNIDEEEFVETWMAYSVTHLNGDVPTVETLAQMERKELSSNDKTSINSRQVTTPLTVYNKTPSTKKNLAERKNQLETTPKGSKNEGFSARQLVASASKGTFSPASFSPIATTPSGKYSARSNAGESVCELTQRVAGDWKAKDQMSLTIAPYRDEALTSNCRIMMEPLLDKMEVLNDVIERIGSFLVEKNGLEEPVSNRQISPMEKVCLGRVCCDSNDHLNPSSVLLEGSSQLCQGQAIPLDLSKVTHYSLFPGQIVAVAAVNPTGQRLIVNRLFHSAPLPMPPQMPRFSSALEMVVAAGPFTQSCSLAFEPLEDLMRYVKSHRPHVLILIGPLLDLRQAQLTASSLAETYEDLFNKIVKGVMDELKGSWTQVVVVASARDGACLPVYPTPPPLGPRPAPSPSLHLVSDPSLLSINGLVVGLTSTDSVMHLGKEEISYPPAASDRLGRLASHLLQQQSFYPLSPPQEELAVDSELWDTHASLPVTPHVLVVPSNFRHFLKNLHGCLVVNPEYLVKGEGGGTFARLEVQPPSDNTWSTATHISAQVLKI